MLPFGGAKGYGLCFAIQLMGMLAGGDPIPVGTRNWGHLFVAIDPTRFIPLDAFTARVGHLVEAVKNSRRMEVFGEILIPGEAAAASGGSDVRWALSCRMKSLPPWRGFDHASLPVPRVRREVGTPSPLQ